MASYRRLPQLDAIQAFAFHDDVPEGSDFGFKVQPVLTAADLGDVATWMLGNDIEPAKDGQAARDAVVAVTTLAIQSPPEFK